MVTDERAHRAPGALTSTITASLERRESEGFQMREPDPLSQAGVVLGFLRHCGPQCSHALTELVFPDQPYRTMDGSSIGSKLRRLGLVEAMGLEDGECRPARRARYSEERWREPNLRPAMVWRAKAVL